MINDPVNGRMSSAAASFQVSFFYFENIYICCGGINIVLQNVIVSFFQSCEAEMYDSDEDNVIQVIEEPKTK